MKKKIKISMLIILIVLGLTYLMPSEKVTTISIKNKTKMTATTDSGFADDNFYACVLESFGAESGTVLTDEQLSTITNINCYEKDINDTKGLEKLTSLQVLNLRNNNISSIDVSKNTSLQVLNLNSNNLTNIDISLLSDLQWLLLTDNNITNIDLTKNTKIQELELNKNKITKLNLENNTELSRINISSNNLSNLDLSNNNKLRSIYASNNEISNIKLPTTDTVENIVLNHNRINSIDLSGLTGLTNLNLSVNQLSSIDLSKNINLIYLYISSNNLTSIDLSELKELQSFNAVLNKFDSPNIPYPEKLVSLTVEADWIENYDFSKFSNLNSLNINDYYIVPVYGTTFSVSNFSKYKSNNINYNEHILYKDFNKRTDDYVEKSNTITGTLSEKSEYTICSTNVTGYHDSCGNDIQDSDLTYDDNVSISNISSYSKKISYEGYRELRYMTLTSNKYPIDENNNIIDTGEDNDETIISNLKVSWNDATIKINNNKLEIYYLNNELVKEFNLKRTGNFLNIENIPTGTISLTILLIAMIVSLISIIIIKTSKKNYQLINKTKK